MNPNLDALDDVVTHYRPWIDALNDFRRSNPDRDDMVNAVDILYSSRSTDRSVESRLPHAREASVCFPQIREALEAKISEAEQTGNWDPAGDVDDTGYWKHELRALDRLSAEVERLSGYEPETETVMSM